MQVTIQETATSAQEHPLLTAVFPRFTPQEALILNTIASANPGYATLDDILRVIARSMRPSPYGGPTRSSLIVSVCLIRAKLGEPKRNPKRLISIYEMTPEGFRAKLIGYHWKG